MNAKFVANAFSAYIFEVHRTLLTERINSVTLLNDVQSPESDSYEIKMMHYK